MHCRRSFDLPLTITQSAYIQFALDEYIENHSNDYFGCNLINLLKKIRRLEKKYNSTKIWKNKFKKEKGN